MTWFQSNVDVLKTISLIVKCNSSSNVNQYKSLLLHVKIGNHLFRQCIGILMGTNCGPHLASLFLYPYEVELLKKSNLKLAKAFNLTLRYTDDLISINTPRFKQFVKDIYLEELVVSETSESRNVLS